MIHIPPHWWAVSELSRYFRLFELEARTHLNCIFLDYSVTAGDPREIQGEGAVVCGCRQSASGEATCQQCKQCSLHQRASRVKDCFLAFFIFSGIGKSLYSRMPFPQLMETLLPCLVDTVCLSKHGLPVMLEMKNSTWPSAVISERYMPAVILKHCCDLYFVLHAVA